MNKRTPRKSTPFEKFEGRLTRWAFGIFLGGAAALGFGHKWLFSMPLLGLAATAVWLGASIYAVSRLRSRYESVGAYKRRVHYSEQEDE